MLICDAFMCHHCSLKIYIFQPKEKLFKSFQSWYETHSCIITALKSFALMLHCVDIYHYIIYKSIYHYITISYIYKSRNHVFRELGFMVSLNVFLHRKSGQAVDNGLINGYLQNCRSRDWEILQEIGRHMNYIIILVIYCSCKLQHIVVPWLSHPNGDPPPPLEKNP